MSGIDLHGSSRVMNPANRRNRNAVKLNLVARKKSFTEQAAEYSTLALVLPVATFVGWLLGHLLDKGLGTDYLNIVGLLLGSVAGFVQLIRQVMRDTHDNDG
ncbi:MAG: AtpZ/AtpI family protein [Bryobacteraceae bacterium]|jgi:F0F1-type ATP synthase assembly protein I